MDHIAELSELENELGQLLLTEQECAGVYYLVAQRDDEAIATEYYAVTDTPIISQEAREYGKKHSIFWLFSKAEDGRDMMVKVTDPALLEATGGIVQGMSGSPILQDGRLVGAVTHVLVGDSTQGYGILAQRMMETGEA